MHLSAAGSNKRLSMENNTLTQIDNHRGASINRIGYKTFSINLIEDREVCDGLIRKIKYALAIGRCNG